MLAIRTTSQIGPGSSPWLPMEEELTLAIVAIMSSADHYEQFSKEWDPPRALSSCA